MFSYLRFKGILSLIIQAAYLIVCFPVFVRTFFLRKGFCFVAYLLLYLFTLLAYLKKIENSFDKRPLCQRYLNFRI